jgi:hypothetical protein
MLNSAINSPTKEINKKLLMSIHQDGFYDILAGVIVIIFGLIPILDATGLTPGVRQVILLLIYGVSIFFIIWLKRRITLPRTGFVQLSKKTTTRMSVIMLIVNIVIFLVFAGVYVLDVPMWNHFGSYQLSVPLGLIFLIMLSFTGGLFKAPRFYLYGILVLVSFIGFEHLFLMEIVAHHGIPWAGFVSGGIILLSGGLKLCTFIKRYGVEYES